LEREVNGVMQALSKPARAAIARELGLETYTAEGITQRMLNVENAMTYVLRKIKEIEKRVEVLERKMVFISSQSWHSGDLAANCGI